MDAVGFDDDKKKWVLETIHRDVKTLMQKNSNETENNPPASGSPVIGYLDSETVERIKKEYPPGTRVELVKMNDPYTKLKPGDRGTVSSVDDIGTVHVDWDCGSGLGVAYGVDRIIKLPPEEET